MLNSKNMTKESLACSGRFFDALKHGAVQQNILLVRLSVQQTYIQQQKLNKRSFHDSGDGPLAKYRKVLDETENLISANFRFLTKNHFMATYVQTKRHSLFLSQKIWVSQMESILFHCKFKLFSFEVFVRNYTLQFIFFKPRTNKSTKNQA